MKQLQEYINETFKLTSKTKTHRYHPTTKADLLQIITTKYCRNGTYLDCRDIDVSEMTTFHEIFKDCAKAKTIDIRGWNSLNVTSMYSMFYNCMAVEEIKGIEDLDVSKCTNFQLTFFKCEKLKKLDLSKWSINNDIKHTNGAFVGTFLYCPAAPYWYDKEEQDIKEK